MAEIIRVRLGVAANQREVVIPVLATRPNREWKAQFSAAFGGIVDQLAKNADGSALLGLVAGMTDEQLRLLRAYDRSGALPPDEWIDDNATDAQILSAFLGVTAAAFPLADTLIQLVRESPDLQSVLKLAYLRSTTSPPPSGDGGPATSSSTSPTSSSSTYSTPQPTVSRTGSKRTSKRSGSAPSSRTTARR